MSFFAELKRRNVFRVALFYLVASWLIVQVAETLLPVFDVPDTVIRIIVLILALGFPLAVVFAWAFELTPEGIKLDRDAKIDPAAKRQTANKLNWATMAVAALAIGLLIADRLMPESVPHPTGVDEPTPAQTTSQEAVNQEDTKVASMPDSASIAVLPFVNMSTDASNEYFADGISEELLNILAGIDGLRVASRTSAFSFKDSKLPIPEIAGQLGVGHILEGSVRRQGNRVRITAQLIEAGKDAHLWSEVYDRELVDIFQVQEEIAQSITTELEGILGTRQVDVAAPTMDMDAYELYLRGRSRFYRRLELNEAVEDLRAAVEQDPDFAEAWAFLAAIYWLHGNGGYQSDYDRAEMTRLAGLASARASELDAEIPIALAVQGQIAADSGRPGAVGEGIRLLERAVAMPAPDTTPRLWLALLWMELGHPERAEPLLARAREMDLLVGINSGALGVSLGAQGQSSRAEQLVLESAQLGGLTFWGDLLSVNRFHAEGPESAKAFMRRILNNLDERREEEGSANKLILAAVDDPAAQTAILSEWQDYGDTDIASLLFDQATRALEAAPFDQNRPWAIILAAWLPAMQWLREDPRYFELMARRGRVDYWETHGYPQGCRPADGTKGRHLRCPEAAL